MDFSAVPFEKILQVCLYGTSNEVGIVLLTQNEHHHLQIHISSNHRQE